MGRPKKREPFLLTLDTETVGLDGELRRIAVYDGKDVTYGYTFKDVEYKLIKYYEEGYRPYCYIHNADFDLRKLPEIWEKGNILWNTTKKIGNKYATVTCAKYTIKDSFKILPSALAKLSKDFDVTHGKLDLWEEVQKTYPGQYEDVVDFLARCPVDDPLYLKYLGYDVISLYEVLQRIMQVAKMELADFVSILSTASLSRYLLKNGYGGEPFRTPGNKTDYEILTSCPSWGSEKLMKESTISYLECEYKIREAFYGGRTEVFTPYLAPDNGKIVGYHYDVNSLYPTQFYKEYPVGYPSYEDNPRLIAHNWEWWQEYREGLGFIKAEVYIPPQAIPPLPVKMGKLVFVTGHVVGSWTYLELDYAVKNCGVEIVRFIEQIHFKKTYPVFKNAVETFYPMKEQGKRDGNASLTAFSKLVLNTMYGWTCLRRDDKTALRDISMLDKWKDSERMIYVNEEMGYFEIFDKVNATSIQVQIGAYVTSYARLTLLDALRKQAEKGTVYYCDTDSIVCDTPMDADMIDPYELGKWDLEAELLSAIFVQPKVYTETTTKHVNKKFKGISRKFVQEELGREDYEEILNMYRAGIATRHIIERGRKILPSLAVAQKRHENPNQLKESDKRINTGTKQKRNIDFNANTSSAWHLGSIEEFERFSFKEFDNPPEGENLFGG